MDNADQNNQLDLKKDEPNFIGTVGEKIITLAKESTQAILSRWDEKTMEVIKKNGGELVKKAEDIVITDAETFAAANEFAVDVAEYEKKGEEFIEPMVKATHEPWKLACSVRREFNGFSEKASKIAKEKLAVWRSKERKRVEQEQIRLNEERKAQEEAERKKREAAADLERKKAAQKLAESERLAKIERGKAAEAERKQKEAEDRAAEAERKQKEAEDAQRKAEKENDEAAAEAAKAEAKRLEDEKEKEQQTAAAAVIVKTESEQKGLKIASSGEAEAAKHENKANIHDEQAKNVFFAQQVASPTVQKSETTSSGKIIGRKDWSITIIDELEIVKAVVTGIENGGFPISVLNLKDETLKAALKRWAIANFAGQRYEKNGVIIERTESISARVNKKK